MPPKKKAKTFEGQQKLIFSAFSNSNERHRSEAADDSVPLAAEAAQASAIDSAPSSSNSSTASNQTKARKFSRSWMKTYSWLAYDEKEDYMYCKVCTEHKKKNGMCKEACCKNFQNSTLVRHAAFSDHQMALQKPQIPKQFEAIKEKAESPQNKAVMVLLKCVHWLCVEGLPLVKFKSLLELLHDLGLEDIAILKQSAILWKTQESCPHFHDIHRKFLIPSQNTAHIPKKNTKTPSLKKAIFVWLILNYYNDQSTIAIAIVRFPTIHFESYTNYNDSLDCLSKIFRCHGSCG